jgi:hypothetical protein
VVLVGASLQLSVEGEVRSVVPTLRFDDSSSVAPGTYAICSGAQEIYKNIFRINTVDGCKTLLTSDLLIAFPASPANVLAEDLPSLSDTVAWQSLPGGSEEYLNLAAITASDCTGLNDFSQVTFAKTIDNVWLQWTPRISMVENTVQNPMSDGGLTLWSGSRTLYCGNAPRSFLNEEGCSLSTVSACSYGDLHPDNATVGALICGSPGEVVNDPAAGDSRMDVSSITGENLATELGLEQDTASRRDLSRQRELVWQQIAFEAPDQIRQRMAWALMQIFSIAKRDVRDEDLITEAWLQYYDIFVRNAFGNYLDIMRLVAFSSIMGENLSFVNSRSSAV